MYYLLTRANGLLILIHNTCSCSVFFVLNKNKSMFICYRKVLSHCSVILGKMFGFGAFNNNNLSKSLLEYLEYFIKVFKTVSHYFLIINVLLLTLQTKQIYFWNSDHYQQFLFLSSYVTFSANTQVLQVFVHSVGIHAGMHVCAHTQTLAGHIYIGSQYPALQCRMFEMERTHYSQKLRPQSPQNNVCKLTLINVLLTCKGYKEGCKVVQGQIAWERGSLSQTWGSGRDVSAFSGIARWTSLFLVTIKM